MNFEIVSGKTVQFVVTASKHVMFAFVYISKYFHFMKGKRYFGRRFSFLDGKCIRTVTLLQTRPRFGTIDSICTSNISTVYPRVFCVSLFLQIDLSKYFLYQMLIFPCFCFMVKVYIENFCCMVFFVCC